MSQVWFITGAGRGLGLAIARAALNAGHQVAATGRSAEKITEALGSENVHLLSVGLDVTKPDQPAQAVQAAMERFGRIDVLVNNAGYGQFGIFEESTAAEVEQQFNVNVFGTMEMTRAILPIFRAQRGPYFYDHFHWRLTRPSRRLALCCIEVCA